MSTGDHFVIQKGKAICDKGTACPSFKVSSHSKHYWNDKGSSDAYLAVTEDDTSFIPSEASFGSCSVKNGKPCKFSPVGKWTKTYDKVKIMDKNCVIESSELMCAIGGRITVFQHGQSSSVNNGNFEEAEQDIQEELDPLTDINDFIEDDQPYAF